LKRLEQDPDFVGIVVAAGRSTRFGGSKVKQFRDLAGSTILDRAIASLTGRPGVGGVVVVLPPDERDGPRAKELSERTEIVGVVVGGASRAESVRAGLAATGSAPFVLVHDAARPLAPPALVDEVIHATRRHGAAIPGLAVPDTVKRVTIRGGDPAAPLWIRETVDRTDLRLAQTPQGARRDWLREALELAEREEIEMTDDAAALEHAGRRVALVAGDPVNRKITTAQDFQDANRRLGGANLALRVGSGFDIHRFGANRRLVLGGVVFEGERGLEGHSDADVILHAAMDALLGGGGLGDIGALFPPEDARYADADSSQLAREVVRRIRSSGFEVINLDLTVLAEKPKIRSRVDEMRAAIGRALDLAPERIGLKATTLERLGALGREEGIACQAVVLLQCASDR
jgi:2-C-methyl-D-erythritol 4-phosphate cytidylyltransferase/2-C-methyl-D-erythritol 2,4-cyclodiphosphate synthase